MFAEKKKIGMVGVGGMGMCPLALYLSQMGHLVSGYDDKLQDFVADMLTSGGVQVVQEPEGLNDVDLIVYSSAIRAEHAIMQMAASKGLPLFRRGECLAEIAKTKKLIAVVGSHGKTTTTGMLIHSLNSRGLDFAYVLGAFFRDEAVSAARYSESEWLVAEVDESDGTIEHFSPAITLVVNFDWDHPDKYKTQAELEATFQRLFSRTQERVFVPKEFEWLVKGQSYPVTLFGEGTPYSFQSVEQQAIGYWVRFNEGFVNDIANEDHLLIRGAFNLKNALAAFTVSQLVTGQAVAGSLTGFRGIRRRQDLLYSTENTFILSDYAHHPTEIAALLQAYPRKDKRVLIFQPHRYTRTKAYAAEFAKVFLAEKGQGSIIIFLPVYAASELPSSGLDSDAIVASMGAANGQVHLVTSYPELKELLGALDDVAVNQTDIFFIGAGDIEGYAKAYVNSLKRKVQWEALKKIVSAETVLREEEPMASKTTLQVGGKAQFYAEPASLDDLKNVLQFIQKTKCPLFLIGRGSNILVTDDGFDGLILRLNKPEWCQFAIEGESIIVGAGMRLKELCGKLSKSGYTGFEFLEGIPGTVGGALRMNAGAMGWEMFNIVESITAMRYDGELVEFKKEDLTVTYRRCEELKDMIALGARLKLDRVDSLESVKMTLDEFSQKRKASQPKEASAGCMFKNPANNHAGKLIDQAGLKGSQVGQAQISTIHGNFFVNKGDATSEDVINLVKLARANVQKQFGINLEPEVLIIGKKWRDVL